MFKEVVPLSPLVRSFSPANRPLYFPVPFRCTAPLFQTAQIAAITICPLTWLFSRSRFPAERQYLASPATGSFPQIDGWVPVESSPRCLRAVFLVICLFSRLVFLLYLEFLLRGSGVCLLGVELGAMCIRPRTVSLPSRSRQRPQTFISFFFSVPSIGRCLARLFSLFPHLPPLTDAPSPVLAFTSPLWTY